MSDIVKKHRKVTLEPSVGSGMGHAVYLVCTDENGGGDGFRIAGGKCYGYVEPVYKYELSIGDLEDIIREAKLAIQFLKRKKKRD